MAGEDDERVTAWTNLVQARRVVDNALQRDLQTSVGLSVAEFEVLSRLSTADDGALRMVDLASLLLLSKSGMTRIIDRLERDGLVVRETPPDNRRVVYTRITLRGTRVLRRATVVFLDALDGAFSDHLSDSDIRSLRRVLRKLLAGNGEWEDQRCSTFFRNDRPAVTAR